MEILGISGLGFFPEQTSEILGSDPFPEENGNPGLTFSIGKSEMHCFALWERWELQLFPENFIESPKLGFIRIYLVKYFQKILAGIIL